MYAPTVLPDSANINTRTPTVTRTECRVCVQAPVVLCYVIHDGYDLGMTFFGFPLKRSPPKRTSAK